MTQPGARVRAERVTNHHDTFFKKVFGTPKAAAEHFERFLPTDVVGALDLSTLTLVPGSFADETLKERRTDLLFPVARGGARDLQGGSSASPRRVSTRGSCTCSSSIRARSIP